MQKHSVRKVRDTGTLLYCGIVRTSLNRQQMNTPKHNVILCWSEFLLLDGVGREGFEQGGWEGGGGGG